MDNLTDLHRHLDGSIRQTTLHELARRAGVVVPQDLTFHAGMGLERALSRFAFTLSLLQRPETVTRVAREMCEDAIHEGVSTLEIRFAPQLHGGAPVEAIIDAALEGIDGRAGLILCALYPEPPTIADTLVAAARTRPGVVGLDLAAAPAPDTPWGLEDWAPAFQRAAEIGLGRTVHAGEGKPASQIRAAVEHLGANRIGHGCSVLEDETLVDLLIARGVTLEACPTSNVHTDVFESVEEHPLPRWLDRGLSACINTDNTLLSAVDAPEEYRRASGIPGMTPAHLARAIACGHAAAFRRG